MKKIMMGLMLALAFSAHAEDVEKVTTIGFGKDGASNKVVPNENSQKDAAEIYKALGGQGKKILIENDDTSVKFFIESFEDNFAMGIVGPSKDIVIEDKGNMSVAVIPRLRGNVTIQGGVAEALYNKLNIEPSMRIGASAKQAGNLTCSQALVSGGKYVTTCKFVDVGWLQMQNF